MERRYLAATIAMAATFAIFSHAFGSGLLSKMQHPQEALVSEMHCAAQTLRAHLLDKVNRSLGAGSAEEAQLRVELNLPAPAAVAPAPPAPPARPVAAKAPAAPAIACPSQRLVSLRMPRDFDQQMQLKMIAMQSRAASRAMQHEIAAMAQAQTRLAAMQTRIAHLSCRGSQQSNWSNNVVQVHSRGNRVDVDLDMDRLSREIDEEVSRSMANSVRNF
jgi:hypothetical protein